MVQNRAGRLLKYGYNHGHKRRDQGFTMKTTSIAHAKNNLSSLIQKAERSKPIHLTRHGKPVAVIISEADYPTSCIGFFQSQRLDKVSGNSCNTAVAGGIIAFNGNRLNEFNTLFMLNSSTPAVLEDTMNLWNFIVLERRQNVGQYVRTGLVKAGMMALPSIFRPNGHIQGLSIEQFPSDRLLSSLTASQYSFRNACQILPVNETDIRKRT